MDDQQLWSGKVENERDGWHGTEKTWEKGSSDSGYNCSAGSRSHIGEGYDKRFNEQLTVCCGRPEKTWKSAETVYWILRWMQR